MVVQYFRPRELDAALDWLAQNATGGARVAAGCTDLFPATSRPRLSGPILDITAIDGLRGITETHRGWRIGGATTWTDIIRANLPESFDGLKLAAAEIGSVQIQNAGTLAGNLCNASPAADGVPCLLTLDASVELCSAENVRALALTEFLKGPRQTNLAPGEIVTAITVPKRSATGRSGFLKLGARKYLVIAIAMVAVRLGVEAGKIDAAAIAVGSCSAVAARLPEAEAALMGQPLDADTADNITAAMITSHLSPIDDVRGDAAYRLKAACELVRRVVAGLGAVPEERV